MAVPGFAPKTFMGWGETIASLRLIFSGMTGAALVNHPSKYVARRGQPDGADGEMPK
jgi:hypothetical protein